MGHVPEHVIREIRERVDLVELIGAYVSLKRTGRSFVGLCPFHQEKAPSFNVNPDRGIYHCFGCGVTGDGIRFLMDHDHLSFPEALRTLADRVGIDLKPYERAGEKADEFDLLYRAHEVAARFYQEVLAGKEGRRAREHIARRGLSEAVVAQYRLGASPAAWDRLLNVARRDGVPAGVLVKAGLAIPREGKSGHYDRFRDRWMFPITTASGKVIGFGGRVLDDSEPKYLNSPETPLFAKRKILYGLPQAAAALREKREAILVEGYVDVLSLAGAGIGNALASLGTAFTPEHARSLARIVERVHVVFDGDAAGLKAAHASAGPLLGSGLEVRMAILPAGEDPDSLVRSRGAEGFLAEVAKGRGAVETLLGDEAYEGGAATERAVRRVLTALAEIDDRLRRRVYVQEVAGRTGIPEEVLEGQLRTLARRRREDEERRHPEAEEGRRSQGAPARGRKGEPPSALERTFVGVVLHDSRLAGELLSRFRAEEFENPAVRRVIASAAEIAGAGGAPTPAILLDALRDDAEATALVGELAVAAEYGMETERQAVDCGLRLQRRSLEKEGEHVIREMRKAMASGEEEKMRELARRRADIASSIAALDAQRSSAHHPSS